MRTQRQLRVGEEIRHALAHVLQTGDVPWSRAFLAEGDVPLITVTEVQVSPDLKNATAYVLPMNGERAKPTIKALNDLNGFFRHQLAEAVNLRFVPKLRFTQDESFAYASRIEQILQDPAVAKDLVKPAEDETETP